MIPDYSTALLLTFVLFGASAAAVVWCRGWSVESRGATLALAASWLVVATVEYWIAGGASFLNTGSELEHSLPVYLYQTAWHDGGQFSHAFAGGNDWDAMYIHSGQFLSLERTLVAFLPLGLAQFLHKCLVFGIGLAGTYLLARRVADASREQALAVAALAAYGHDYLATATWHHGIGFAGIPLALYLCVFRAGKPGFWSGVMAFAALNAVSSSPTHSNLALLATIALTAPLAGRRMLPRAVGALAVILLCLGANWHESLFAKMVLAPWSFRGTAYSYASADGAAFTEKIETLLGLWRLWLAIGAASLAVLAWRRRPWLGWAATLSLCLSVGPLLEELPWSAIGLRVLHGINFRNSTYGLPAVVCLMVAFALASLPRATSPVAGGSRLGLAALAVVVGLAVGNLARLKAANLSNWLSQGGLAVLGTENLIRRDWQPDHPFRVVTFPYRLPVQIMPALGLETIDGNYNLVLRSVAEFWRDGILKHPMDMSSGFVTLETPSLDMKCCADYDITAHADIELLRMLNVEYVLSTLPLHGGELRLVDGPSPPSVPPRQGQPATQRLKAYLRLATTPDKAYVYALPQALPRVYGASRVEISPATDYDRLRVVGPSGGAIVDPAWARQAGGGAQDHPGARVVSFQLVKDGINATLETAGPGFVVANIPYTPFWSARADGRDLTPVPVNKIQMGVFVPAGTQALSFTYRRPTLRGTIAARLFAR